MCKKLSKAAIKDLVKEARNRTKKITSDVKELRKEMKAANVIKKDDLKRVNRSNKKTLKEYAQSSFYQLKYKCGKKIRPETKFREFAETDSVVVGLNGDIEAYGDRIQELKVGLSSAKKEHRVKLKEIQQAVAEEKDADQKKAKQEHALATLRSSIKSNKQVVNEEIRNLTKKKKQATREKKSRFREIRKELKQAVRESKKAQREVKKQEQALRKTLKKQDRLHAEITSDTLRDMVQRYGQELDQQLRGL
jgi:N-acetylglucosaminyldiphosphoundecaprenol N-acetyl-beta-D-mannosaminyltransferase